jgi:fructose-bisphosphate aldolase, class II
MKKDLKYYYAKAKKERKLMIQFNWSSAEMLKGIAQAAAARKSPLLLGTSEGDSGFVGLSQAVALRDAWRKDTGLPIFLNLDHGHSFEYLKSAIDAGYDAVHFDGSKLPLKENIAITKKVTAYARKYKVSVVEGEVGHVMGGSSLHKEKTIRLNENEFTNPDQARDFARQTKVDSLAVTFGNVHGIYANMPRLDFERLKKIANSVESFLVLHGGSGIPQKDIQKAVQLGIVKMNISTELRAAYVESLRTVLKDNPDEVTPYKLFPKAVEAVQKKAEQYITWYQ